MFASKFSRALAATVGGSPAVILAAGATAGVAGARSAASCWMAPARRRLRDWDGPYTLVVGTNQQLYVEGPGGPASTRPAAAPPRRQP